VAIPTLPVMDTALRDATTSLIYSAFFLVWKNELDSARKLNVWAMEQAKSGHFTDDSVFQKVISELHVRIQERNCFNLQSSFEFYLEKTRNQFGRRQFAEAAISLAKAREVFLQKETCDLSDSLLHKLEARCAPVFAYERIKTARDASLTTADYPQADSLSREMDLMVSRAIELCQEVRHISWMDVISQQRDRSLTAAALQSALHREDVETSLSLIRILRTQSPDPEPYCTLQKRCAHLLAQANKPEGKEPTRQLLETYGLEDSWYTCLKKEFQKIRRQSRSR
jgi:hypothetical protein